jgi:triacylglycerol lipase
MFAPLLLCAALAAFAGEFGKKLPTLPALPVSAASAGQQGPSSPAALPAFSLDRTADLKALQRVVREGAAKAMPAQASKVNYLMIPGHTWQALPGYFQPNVERLQALGLNAKLVETEAFGRVADNAKYVRRAIEASDKPVVIIGHSRGGLEAIEALKQDPSLAKKVHAVVAVQTPWGGTPAANLAPKLLLPGSAELSEDRRLTNGVPELPEGVELRSIATSLGAFTRAKPLAYLAARLLGFLSGRPTDGIVPTEAAVIPGSIFALLSHVGHWDTVATPGMLKLLSLGARSHDRNFAADFTEAVVRWLFLKPGKKK